MNFKARSRGSSSQTAFVSRILWLASVVLFAVVGLPNRAQAADASASLWWSGADAPRDLETGQVVNGWGRTTCARAVDGTPLTNTYDAIFENDLFVQTDLVLPGIASVQTVTFTRPRTWDLMPETELRLIIEHSSSLIPERSHLTVYLNEINLASVRLDATNASSTEVRIRLPVASLKPFNVLKMSVTQHYTDDCEDPFDPALWTKVSRRSAIHFVYTCLPVQPDLGSYPLPIFDRQGYGPTVLSFVLPDNPSVETLKALGVVTAALGRDVSYGHLAIGTPVAKLDGAPGNVILVGTPEENREIGGLIGDEIEKLSAGQGIVALLPNPFNPFAAVLVVSGRDSSGVALAARTLAGVRRHEVLSGQVSVIAHEVDLPPAKIREGARLIPANRDTFTLEELGAVDRTVRGFFASPIRVELRTLPDMQFYDRKQTLHLHYSYGAQLEGRLSTLEVRWNNVTLQSIPLDNPDGENSAWVEVNIPTAVMTPYNDLQFVFNLFPRGYDVCTTKTDRQLWGTLFADTGFTMPHYFWVQMPDLGYLKYEMYPFGLYQDLSGTAIVLPDRPADADVMAGLTLAAELGRATRADRVALTLARASDLQASEKRDNHLIVIASGRPNSVLEELRSRRLLDLRPGEKRLRESGEDVLHGRDPNNFGTLEQIVSPFGGSEKTVTVVQGLSDANLKKALRMMTDIRWKSRISGSIALASEDNDVTSFDQGEKVTFGEKPMTVALQEKGRSNFWLVVVVVLIALFVVYLCLRYLLKVYGKRHHPEDEEDGEGSAAEAGSGDGADGVVEYHPEVVTPGKVSTTELVSAELDRQRGGAGHRPQGAGEESKQGMERTVGKEMDVPRPHRRLPPRKKPRE